MEPEIIGTEPVVENTTPEAPSEDFVSFESIKPKTPGSRREQAEKQRQDLADLQAWKTKFETDSATERQTYQQRLAEQAEHLAHLRGQLEARQTPPPPVVVPPARPDPVELRKRARKALETDKDMDTYEELRDQAARIDAQILLDEQAKTLREEFASKMPRQTPPQVQALFMQNPHVAAAGDRGEELVEIRARELKFRGVKPGPALLAQAFKQANDELAPKTAASTAAAAQALTAPPVARSAGGSSKTGPGAGYAPTAEEKAAAARFNMSIQDYVKYKFEGQQG